MQDRHDKMLYHKAVQKGECKDIKKEPSAANPNRLMFAKNGRVALTVLKSEYNF